MYLLIYLFLISVACCIAGYFAAAPRDSEVAGAMLGLLLGPMGVLAAMVVDVRPKCPKCMTHRSEQARVCPGCHAGATVDRSDRQADSREIAYQPHPAPPAPSPKRTMQPADALPADALDDEVAKMMGKR